MKLILKILAAPVTMLISLFVWICAGLISCSTIVFKLASGLIALMALAVLFTYSVQNGIQKRYTTQTVVFLVINEPGINRHYRRKY